MRRAPGPWLAIARPTRVTHRIEPNGEACHLALLQCPLLVPARRAPGASDEYESGYMLLGDAPASLRALTAMYRFQAEARMP
jgi:hypothetical protein